MHGVVGRGATTPRRHGAARLEPGRGRPAGCAVHRSAGVPSSGHRARARQPTTRAAQVRLVDTWGRRAPAAAPSAVTHGVARRRRRCAATRGTARDGRAPLEAELPGRPAAPAVGRPWSELLGVRRPPAAQSRPRDPRRCRAVLAVGLPAPLLQYRDRRSASARCTSTLRGPMLKLAVEFDGAAFQRDRDASASATCAGTPRWRPWAGSSCASATPTSRSARDVCGAQVAAVYQQRCIDVAPAAQFRAPDWRIPGTP